MSLPFTFKPFQKETVGYGVKHPYVIYALSMGTGKTLCALATAVETASYPCLIVCPSYLRLKWEAEIRKFFPGKTIASFANDKEFYPIWDVDFAIISYYFLEKAEMLFEWAQMVVFDEAHFLKTMDAKRTEASHRLVFENSIKRVLLLTGTPIKNRVYEFYSLIAICNYNPEIIGESEFLKRFPSFVDFANHFSFLSEHKVKVTSKKGGTFYKNVQQWEGYRNVDELKTYLADIYIRFGPEVLGLEEPIIIDVPVSYKDDPELLEAFNDFTDNESSVSSPLKAKSALMKVPFTIEYVKNLLDQCEQVVVYTDHVEACIALAKGLGVPAITGTMPMKKRQKLADEFQAGKSKVIVATIGSFSTGIDLFSAFNMVLNDPSWTPGDMDQAFFRIMRIGQMMRCIFHRIMGSPQDLYIYDKLEEKIATIKAVL